MELPRVGRAVRGRSANEWVCVHFDRRLSHCKLVQLYAVHTQRSPMCLVFEFMDNGCLSDYLRARKGHFSQDTMLSMCMDVSEGMAYLENSNFIHRDLVNQKISYCHDAFMDLQSVGIFPRFPFLLQAARNCLVSKNNEVKVSDFGMTRYAPHRVESLMSTVLC